MTNVWLNCQITPDIRIDIHIFETDKDKKIELE